MNFDERIINLQRELTTLKTTAAKSATTLETKTASGTLNFNLTITRNPVSGATGTSSTQRAIVTITSQNNRNFLSMLTFGISTLDGRGLQVLRRPSSAGVAQFCVVVGSGNQDDYQTLIGGGSISLSYGFTVTATADFSMSVSYENYNPYVN